MEVVAADKEVACPKVALSALEANRGGSGQAKGGQRKESGSDGRAKVCWNCDQTEHLSPNCPRAQGRATPRPTLL